MILRMKKNNKISELKENIQRKIMSELGAEGMLETMKKIREEGCSWDFNTCVCAAKNVHLKTLNWTLANIWVNVIGNVYILQKDEITKNRRE